jgi:UDPglucose 6-dehydrogenase
MRGKVVVDLRNVFDPIAMREAGFGYFAIGRAQSQAAN